MIFFDILLFSLWILSLVIIIRLIIKSGKLHYNSNKILLLILAVFTYALVRHIFLHQVQEYYNINFPIALIFNSSIACLIPILAYLYVKKIISWEHKKEPSVSEQTTYIFYNVMVFPKHLAGSNIRIRHYTLSFILKSVSVV